MSKNSSIILGIDFDGTLVEHEFPDIGPEVPGAFDWLKKFQAAGAKLILWTMRSDGQKAGPVLSQAVEFCRSKGIEFWGVNSNPDQHVWTSSPKAYCHHYIDDASICCPLVKNIRVGGRPYVNWNIVGPEVMKIIEDYSA